jgi:hypothetical protein
MRPDDRLWSMSLISSDMLLPLNTLAAKGSW